MAHQNEGLNTVGLRLHKPRVKDVIDVTEENVGRYLRHFNALQDVEKFCSGLVELYSNLSKVSNGARVDIELHSYSAFRIHKLCYIS